MRGSPIEMTTHADVELRGSIDAEFEEVLTPGALAFVAALQREFGARRRQLLEARATRRARLADGRAARLPDRHARDPRGRLAGRAGPRGHAAALGRDHRPDRSQDDDQRAELRRRRVHGRLRGRQRADLAQHGRGPRQPARRDRRHDHLPDLGRARLRAGRRPGDAAGAPARLAPARAPPAGRRRAGLGRAVRLRPVLLPLRAAAAGATASGPYFYLPKMESHLEARLWNDVFCFAQDAARHAARDDQGDGADRDAAGGVRDGGDPLRAARALGGTERRPLGLHLLLDQVLPGPARDGPARPRRRDDDGAVHARLHRAAGGHLPPPRRPRDGRDGGADPVAQGRGGQREGARRRARRQGARGRPGLRRHLGRPPRPGAGRPARCSSRGSNGAPNQLERQRDDVHVTAERAARPESRPRARSPRPACGPTSTSASSTSRSGSAAAARRRSTR